MLIFDIVRFSNEVVTKRECLLLKVKKTQTWIHGKIHSILFYFDRDIRYSVGCHGDGGTVSRNNVRSTIFQNIAKPSEVKENTNEQFHSLLLYCTSLYCSFCRRSKYSQTITKSRRKSERLRYIISNSNKII